MQDVGKPGHGVDGGDDFRVVVAELEGPVGAQEVEVLLTSRVDDDAARRRHEAPVEAHELELAGEIGIDVGLVAGHALVCGG